MSSTKLLHIEKLRGISVLLVLFYHLGVPGFQFGYFGVDLFLVVSGYLMAMLYGEIKSKAEVMDFFVRRGARLLPAYFTVLALTAVVGVLLLLPHEIEHLMTQGVWSAALLPNFGFWQNAVYFDSIMLRPLLNFWSLGVELQFYLVFPLLLLVKRVNEKWLIVFALLSFLIAVATSIADPKTAFFMLPSRLWEFMVGYYTYRLISLRGITNNTLGLAALLALLALLFTLSALNPDPVFLANAAIVLLSAAVIGLGFSTGSDLNVFSKTLVTLGKYSYSIYLVHFPIIVLVNYAPFDGNNLFIKSPASLALILGLTALLAFLLHQFVEIKTRHHLKGKHLAFGVVSICALLAASINPAITLSKQKLSPAALAINNGREDRGSFRCDASFDRRISENSSCRLNLPENPSHSFLLFGDSHADMIKPGLLNVLNGNNQSLRYINGYSPILAGLGRLEFINEAADHNVQTIVIHQTLRSDNGVTLRGFIEKAAESNIQVVFIAPVPIYFFSVPQKLYQDYLATGEVLSDGMPATEHYQEAEELFANLKTYSEEFDNFTWHDGAKNLCSDSCLISNAEGKPLYYDNNHLTLTGAQYLQNIFFEIGDV